MRKPKRRPQTSPKPVFSVWYARLVLTAWLAAAFGAAAWSFSGLGPKSVEDGWSECEGRVGPEEERALIVLDPGHGGIDAGTQGHGLLEKDWTLDVAARVRRELESRGIRVLMTREADIAQPLTVRSRMANESGAACLVSIHFNHAIESAVSGIESYYSAVPPEEPRSPRYAVSVDLESLKPKVDRGAASRRLAECVQSAAADESGMSDRGTRNRPDLAVTREAGCPATLIECAFLSNAGDAQRVRQPSWRDRVARGIARGIIDFLKRGSVQAIPHSSS